MMCVDVVRGLIMLVAPLEMLVKEVVARENRSSHISLSKFNVVVFSTVVFTDVELKPSLSLL